MKDRIKDRIICIFYNVRWYFRMKQMNRDMISVFSNCLEMLRLANGNTHQSRDVIGDVKNSFAFLIDNIEEVYDVKLTNDSVSDILHITSGAVDWDGDVIIINGNRYVVNLLAGTIYPVPNNLDE